MPGDKLKPWKTRSRRTILDHSRFLKVERHIVEMPDGEVIDDWPWVIIPSAAIVLPMTADGRFLCFRQVKYGLGGRTMAPIGGMIEAGEPPLEAARRELIEETGCIAAEWVDLGNCIVDPNR